MQNSLGLSDDAGDLLKQQVIDDEETRRKKLLAMGGTHAAMQDSKSALGSSINLMGAFRGY